jgi:hypothetical protein
VENRINPDLNPGSDAENPWIPDTEGMTITDYLLNIALVSLVIIQVRGHKITIARLLFPVIATVWVATQFLHSIPTAGNDVVLEAGLAMVGCALGVGAGLTTTVRRDGAGVVAKAGVVAAFLWVFGIGARVAFSLWATHGGQGAIGSFSIANHITAATAWSAAFVLMALAEVLSRTGILALRAVRSGGEIPRGGLRQWLASA